MVYPSFKEQNLPPFPKTILRTKISPVTGKWFHRTEKRHRKDTEKKRQAIFSATKPSDESPRREGLVFVTGFRLSQQKSARGLRRYL